MVALRIWLETAINMASNALSATLRLMNRKGEDSESGNSKETRRRRRQTQRRELELERGSQRVKIRRDILGHTAVDGFSPTLPTELWSRIFELATNVHGTLPTSNTYSPNMLSPYHITSSYDDDSQAQRKLRTILPSKFHLLFVCRAWLQPALLNLYREVYIGSSRGLTCLADGLDIASEGNAHIDIGRSILRLDVAMRDTAEDELVTSVLTRVLNRLARLQILVIRRNFGSSLISSKFDPGARGEWKELVSTKNALPLEVAAAIISSNLPNLLVVSSFYPLLFAAVDGKKKITLLGRFYIDPLKTELGLCDKEHVDNRPKGEDPRTKCHLSIVDYSWGPGVPRILTLDRVQRQQITSVELTDTFGEFQYGSQIRSDHFSRLPAVMEYIAEHFPTVDNIDFMFPRNGHFLHFFIRFPSRNVVASKPLPFKTLGLRIPIHYRKFDVDYVFYSLLSHIVSRSPNLQCIRILDQQSSRIFVHSHHKKMRELLFSFPDIRVEDWRGEPLGFRRPEDA